jgi:hypothetical protein
LCLVGMEPRPLQWPDGPTVWGPQGECVAFWTVFSLYSKSLSWLCFSSVYSPPAGLPGLYSYFHLALPPGLIVNFLLYYLVFYYSVILP